MQDVYHVPCRDELGGLSLLMVTNFADWLNVVLKFPLVYTPRIIHVLGVVHFMPRTRIYVSLKTRTLMMESR